MSSSNNQSWGNPSIGIFTVLLVIFLIWAFAGDRHHLRGAARDLKETVQDAGQDLKSSGREVASTIRHEVQ